MQGKNRRIYVLTDTSQKARRDKLSGIYDHAHTAGWIIRTLEATHLAEEFRHAFVRRHPDGLILDGVLPTVPIPKALRDKLPIVAIDLPPHRVPNTALLVHHDDTASARLAAKTLLGLNLTNFATLETIAPRHWSKLRTETFANEIRSAGYRCSVLRRQKTEVFGSALRNWLTKLPKPCGIFAPNDSLAKIVIDICNELDLSVPGDIAVIGIDNDELVCNTATPSISSIAPDFHLAGRLAAQKLDQLIDGEPLSNAETAFYGPRGVVQRESTRRIPANRKSIGEMVEFIRTNACLGIRVGDVLALTKTPKSTAEMHFRLLVGHSIADEIQRVRLEAVCNLLRTTSTPIAAIAAQCGYRNDNHLKNLFKRKFQRTMSAYRRASQP